MRRVVVVLVLLASALLIAPAAGAKVLLVGTYHGVRGKYGSIQAAVDAARSGDWILVAPGDYKTDLESAPARPRQTRPAGVLVTKPDIWIRRHEPQLGDRRRHEERAGMQQQAAATRTLGRTVKGGAQGLNGIMVWKANKVYVENLTVCNFLGAPATPATRSGGTAARQRQDRRLRLRRART